MIPYNPRIVSDLWNTNSEDEAVWWPRCLWIDPGLATGYSIVWFDPFALLGYARTDVETRKNGKVVGGRVSGDDTRGSSSARSVIAWQSGYLLGDERKQVYDILDFASRFGGRGIVVGCESFVVLRIEQSEAFLSPVRIRAMLDFELWRGLRNEGDQMTSVDRKHLLKQSPSEAKTTFPDRRLQMLDMYTPGPDHPNDAMRHSLLHLRRLAKGGRDLIESLYGWESDWEIPYGE